MERITEITEEVSSNTDTESLLSNENFTLRKRKTENEAPTLKLGDNPALTKQEVKKLQRELVKKPPDADLSKNNAPSSPAQPPPPAPPPPPPAALGSQVTSLACEASSRLLLNGREKSDTSDVAPGSVSSPVTSPCDCPAHLHDRESPLVISQVRGQVRSGQEIVVIVLTGQTSGAALQVHQTLLQAGLNTNPRLTPDRYYGAKLKYFSENLIAKQC